MSTHLDIAILSLLAIALWAWMTVCMRRLREAKRAAEAADRAKNSLLANVSHEIRTPLNAILGMTDLVLETRLDPTQREYLEIARNSGEALLGIVNDILDFSKIEAGRLELDHAAFDLREEVGETMKTLAFRAHSKGLELAWSVDVDMPNALVGDRTRLRQVIINLVGNAIKFTNQGEVVLRVHCQSSSDGKIVARFAVTDTGIGIPEEKQSLIFEAFSQADTSTERQFGGTGLGLAISSRLVESMGGRIGVESRVGRGSNFYFTVRFSRSNDDQRQESPPSFLGNDDVRILVVDDNDTNRRILQQLLHSWGLGCTAAADTDEAWLALRRASVAGHPFQIVIADVGMPGDNGFSLAQRIKQDVELADTGIILLTSGDRLLDVRQCRESGVSTSLLKPVKHRELHDAIDEALNDRPRRPNADQFAETQTLFIRPLRILLAEDSPVNQKLAVTYLDMQGHQTIVVDNGRKALNALEHDDFDLVLMDVQMPEMDGLRATEEIRRREWQTGKRIPIIAMTAFGTTEDRKRCLQAGMDGYISKPVRALALEEVIAACTAPVQVV